MDDGTVNKFDRYQLGSNIIFYRFSVHLCVFVGVGIKLVCYIHYINMICVVFISFLAGLFLSHPFHVLYVRHYSSFVYFSFNRFSSENRHRNESMKNKYV